MKQFLLGLMIGVLVVFVAVVITALSAYIPLLDLVEGQ